MASTNAPTAPIATRPIDDDPALRAAMKVTAAAVNKYSTAAAAVRRIEHVLASGDEPVDELTKLNAMAGFATARLAELEAHAALVVAQRAEQDAREAARQRLDVTFREEERHAVSALRDALRLASKANAVVCDVQRRKHEATQQPFEALSLPALSDLTGWEQRVREHGYGDVQ